MNSHREGIKVTNLLTDILSKFILSYRELFEEEISEYQRKLCRVGWGNICNRREINLNDDNWRFVKFIYLKEQKDLSVSFNYPNNKYFSNLQQLFKSIQLK